MTDKRIGEILEQETSGIFDEREAGITGILNAIHACLKEECIAFATHMNKGKDDRYEARYEWFLRHGSTLGT